MIPRRSGKIVNFGSTAGIAGVPYMAQYTAAKHGVVGLTKSLAVEWGKYNVNVNCICPGATETPMFVNTLSPEAREQRVKRIPLQRFGKTAFKPIRFVPRLVRFRLPDRQHRLRRWRRVRDLSCDSD